MISKNTAAGVHFGGSTGKLERTIVADTRPYSSNSHEPPYGNGYYGCGLNIIRDVKLSPVPPSDVALLDSLVTRNKLFGVSVFNSKATVERTVVRDTSPQAADGDGGDGINVMVTQQDKTPAQVLVRDALVAGNHFAGIGLFSAKGVIERTLVRNTNAAGTTDQLRRGYGLVAGPSWTRVPAGPPLDVRPVLEVRDSTVVASTMAGIAVASADAVIERVRVSDTRPEPAAGTWGDGIVATVLQGHKVGSIVKLRECTVAKNVEGGILLVGSEGTIERTIVRDTLPGATSLAGVGLVFTSVFDPALGAAGLLPRSLALRDSVVTRSRGAGVIVDSSSATVERCRVYGTGVEEASQGWGDGIEVGSTPDATSRARLDLLDSVVDTSARAGAMYYDAGGSVRRCVFRKGILAVDLEEAANPDVRDNVFEENVENGVTWGNKLAPSPPPNIPPPPLP
jgi:hypothetical protein